MDEVDAGEAEELEELETEGTTVAEVEVEVGGKVEEDAAVEVEVELVEVGFAEGAADEEVPVLGAKACFSGNISSGSEESTAFSEKRRVRSSASSSGSMSTMQ